MGFLISSAVVGSNPEWLITFFLWGMKMPCTSVSMGEVASYIAEEFDVMLVRITRSMVRIAGDCMHKRTHTHECAHTRTHVYKTLTPLLFRKTFLLAGSV